MVRAVQAAGPGAREGRRRLCRQGREAGQDQRREDKFIAAQFRIQSIPTVYAFFQGQPVADLTNARTEAQLKRVLDQLLAQLPVKGEAQELAAEIEPLIAMGEQVLADGDAARAESIFSQILDMAPDNPEVIGGLARALIAAGKADEARALLDALPEEAAKHPAIARARAALELATAPAGRRLGRAKRGSRPIPTTMRRASSSPARDGGRRPRRAPPTQLLEIIARDRDWNEGAARKRLLQMLEAVGLEDPWARAQRRRLSAILFT